MAVNIELENYKQLILKCKQLKTLKIHVINFENA